MKSRKYFYILHFIIFSFTLIFSHSAKSSSKLYSPKYSLLNFSSNFSENKSISIWTKEYIFPNISKFLEECPYFIGTNKSGVISIISQNNTLFTIDLKKRIYKTIFNEKNIIKGDNVVLPMEGKLFKVKTENYENEYSDELTTPIKEYVDMTPFYFRFNQYYYFFGNKKYSMIKIIKNENNQLYPEINLDNIIFIDYNLICLKDSLKVWDTTVTNVFLDSDNGDIFVKNKKINIAETVLIYENYNILEKYLKEYLGDKYNEFLYIHAYDKKKKKYVKIYDYNTNYNLKRNNTIDINLEEQYIRSYLNNNNNSDILNEFNYNRKIIYQYKFDYIIYYCIVSFIIICSLFFILNDIIYKSCFSLFQNFKNIFSKKPKNKTTKENNQKIFTELQEYFKPKSTSKHPLDLNKIRSSLQKDIKSIKLNEHSNSSSNLKSYLNKNFNTIYSNKSTVKKNSLILKELAISNEKTKSEEVNPDPKAKTRLEKDFKEITPIRKNIYRNSIDVLLKAKHKIDEQLYAIKIKKLTNPNEEQSIIAEAQNMKKIRSKHIVEYITCWLDTSVGNLSYLFNDKIKKQNEENNDDNFYSSKSNSKVGENNIKSLISNDEIKDDHYIKKLYTKDYLSDDESTSNKKNKINIDNKYYKKKEENNKNKSPKKIKLKEKNTYIDDSSLTNIKSENQKNVSDLSIYFFIQMEFCQEITLGKYIEDHSIIKINNKVIYTFTYQLIKSLAKIHSKNIIHANINPENIFVINEDSIKIGDFSSAKDIELKFKKTINKYSKVSLSQSYQNLMELSTNDEIETNHIEESLYSSPEQNKGTVVSKKSDVYSVGLVLYEMCECFPDEDKRNKGIKLLKKNKTFEEKFKKEYELQCKLILKMIEDDEDKRPSCEELLKSSEMQNWKFSFNEN